MIYADIDISINGNHIIICPCGHEHCRVVRNGRITSSRWSSRNGGIASTMYASTTSSTSNLFYDNYNSSTYTSCSGTWYIC
jgi:hypothetical protein